MRNALELLRYLEAVPQDQLKKLKLHMDARTETAPVVTFKIEGNKLWVIYK